MKAMAAKLVAVALDAAAPDELSEFWARALRWETRDAGAGAVEVVPTDATTFRLLVRPVNNPKVAQNRIHFDLTTTSLDDQRDTVRDLLAAGATHVDIGQGREETHVVLADPEGNELCIIEPFNRFLASCPRLGAVNCDGTEELGRFFSAAIAWPLVWDQDEETAVQAPDGTGPKMTWSGPPLMPRPARERFHLHLASDEADGAAATIDHLVALGAKRIGDADGCDGAVAMADVDGNRFCFVEP